MAASWPRKLVESPHRLVGLRTDQIAQSETLLCVYPKCDRRSSEDYIVQDDIDSSTRFKVTGRKYGERCGREFRDASGLPLFELHRVASKLLKGRLWRVQLPGNNVTDIADVVIKYWTRGLDIRLQNAAAVDAKDEEDKEVTLAVRQVPNAMSIHKVMLGDRKVVDIRESISKNKTLNCFEHGSTNGLYFSPMPRPVWDVRVAEGFDLSLAVLIAVILSDRHSSQVFKAE